MKDYTSNSPSFSSTIQIVETTDPAHADNLNVPVKQLMQNTLVNHSLINAMIGFVYNSDAESIISALPSAFDNGSLTIRDEMAEVSGETLILAVS